ncbi:hypothetical protein GCM10027203_11420 [Nonomuraea fastidiosa]
MKLRSHLTSVAGPVCRAGAAPRAAHPRRLPGRPVRQHAPAHGGLLSDGYVHGLNGVAQAVRERRAGRETALVTGFGGSYGSAALLAW